jgi:L-glyceraldehyde 3-phosphate reductase
VPAGSRAAAGGSFRKDLLTDANLANVRGLNAIAQGRGQTLAQMALAWTVRDPRVASALVGASSVAQLDDNLTALDHLAFEPAELAEIDRFAVEGDVNLWAPSSNA